MRALPREPFAGDLQAALEIVVLLLHLEERSPERLHTARSIVGRLEKQIRQAVVDGQEEPHTELVDARAALDATTDVDSASIRKHLNNAANRLRSVLAMVHG